MSKDSFTVIRNIAAKVGVAAPESSEKIYDYSFLRTIERAVDRIYREHDGLVPVGINADNKLPNLYRTSAGETVSGVALRELGDENRWEEVVVLNEYRLPELSKHSYCEDGTVLIMPEVKT